MELGWAMCLRKRMILIHHEGAEVPTNIVGQVRAIKYRCDMTGLPDLQDALRSAIEKARQQSTPEMDPSVLAPSTMLTAPTDSLHSSGRSTWPWTKDRSATCKAQSNS